MWKMKLIGAGAFLLASMAPALADTAHCTTRIEGEPVTIVFGPEGTGPSSLRERVATRRGTCTGAAVIAYRMPELSPEDRSLFCAGFDPATDSFTMPALGRRDAYGRCAGTSRTCEVVNTSRQTALEIAGLGAEAEAGTLPGRLSSTLSAVTHSTGAMILSGNTSSLAGLLSTAGTTLGTALGSPALLAGAAASVVVIGGAVYLCSGDD